MYVFMSSILEQQDLCTYDDTVRGMRGKYFILTLN